MKAGQIITLLCALVLLLPGTCFAVVGIGVMVQPDGFGWGLLAFLVATPFFAVVAWMIRKVIRWNREPEVGASLPPKQ
jgi:hypothetical protein